MNVVGVVEYLMGIAPRLLTLVLGVGVAIFVHELGHFLAARFAGIRVLKFSIGFPPRLFGWKRGHTEYVVQGTPLGGYVKLSGEEWDDEAKLKSWDLMAQPWYKRVGVYAAGVGMNLILAWFLFWVVLVRGLDLGTYPPVVGEVTRGSEAAKAGVRPGDRIVVVGGAKVANWIEIYTELDRAKAGEPVILEVKRGGGTERLRMRVTEDPGLVPRVDPIVGSVVPMERAEKAGFREGDRVVSVAGRPIASWTEMSAVISKAPEKPLEVRVRRAGKLVDLTVTPRHDPGQNRSFIGISSSTPITVKRRFGPFESAKFAAVEAFMIGVEIPKAIWRVLTGKARFRDVMGGPVMIVRIGMAKAKQGFWDFLHFLGVLNISLLVINLFPIPAVDGGMIVLAVVEGIRGRILPIAVYARLQLVGIVLIASLLFFTVFNDFARIFG